MEFNEKLQQLRMNANLTQEQLADQLSVSRVAITKWESGRGYPSLDSLKEIGKLFNISIDDLLSSKELIKIADNDSLNKQKNLCSLLFCILDMLAFIVIFIPMFENSQIRTFDFLWDLFSLTPFQKILDVSVLILDSVFGIIYFFNQNNQNRNFKLICSYFSLAFPFVEITVFMMQFQPFPCLLINLSGIVKIGFVFKITKALQEIS